MTPLEQLKHVAPCLLITASHDPLRDEGLAYYYRLKKAGVKVTHFHVNGHFHGFLNFELPMFIPGFYESITEMANSHLNIQSKL